MNDNNVFEDIEDGVLYSYKAKALEETKYTIRLWVKDETNINGTVSNIEENALNISSVMQELTASMEEISSNIVTVNQNATDARMKQRLRNTSFGSFCPAFVFTGSSSSSD